MGEMVQKTGVESFQSLFVAVEVGIDGITISTKAQFECVSNAGGQTCGNLKKQQNCQQ